MELITRHIKRQRSNGYIQTFEYTTYDVIFQDLMLFKDDKMSSLISFMRLAFEEGLPERDQSPSGMPELLGIKTIHHENHPLSILVSGADYHGKGSLQHMTVQKYFMKEASGFLAMELPVWDKEASGCIDIVLLKKDPFKITIFDFKPNSLAEKKAASQVYRYAKMLIECTGISPKFIEAFYGDENNTFEVLLTN